MSAGKDIIQALETDRVDPDAGEVKFASFQCRTCDAHGPWANTADKNDPNHAWDSRHCDATGHEKFYMWSITRNTARVFSFNPGRKRGN